MKTEREYLYSIGLTKAPTGRGRFSREAHEALTKARAGGMEFKSTTPVVSTAPKVVKAAKPVKAIVKSVPKDEKPEPGEVQDGFGSAFLRYGRLDMTFEGVDSTGRTHVVSGRNACSCGYSLVGHICDNATALVGGGERIKVIPSV